MPIDPFGGAGVDVFDRADCESPGQERSLGKRVRLADLPGQIPILAIQRQTFDEQLDASDRQTPSSSWSGEAPMR